MHILDIRKIPRWDGNALFHLTRGSGLGQAASEPLIFIILCNISIAQRNPSKNSGTQERAGGLLTQVPDGMVVMPNGMCLLRHAGLAE